MRSVETHLDAVLRAGVAAAVTPGAVLQARRGDSRWRVQVGDQASFGAKGEPLRPADRRPVNFDLRYDLASLTKVFSAITLLRLVDEGLLGIDEPIANWLPEFGAGDKAKVTLRQLLTHTAGVVPTWPGWADYARERAAGAPAQPRADVLAQLLRVPLAEPAGRHLNYSCLGYITAAAAAERATGQPWGELVHSRLLRPLGLRHTGFIPLDAGSGVRIQPGDGPEVGACAPTEYEPEWGRGMICGVVHDETAWALRGVSANAGLFGTIGDVHQLGEAIATGLPGILSESSWHLLWDNQLPITVGRAATAETARNGFAQSCGLRVGQLSFMGASGAQARGHTGFTGTSMVIDINRAMVVTLLTNRVHPTRQGPETAPMRASVAEIVADADRTDP